MFSYTKPIQKSKLVKKNIFEKKNKRKMYVLFICLFVYLFVYLTMYSRHFFINKSEIF